MKTIKLLFFIAFIQLCNLDLRGSELKIHNFGLAIANPEQLIVIEAKESKYDTVQIQTSAICGDCKERLEHDIAFEKGVKSVELDNETKVLTIVFRNDKTTVKDLKIAVTKVGYDADEMPADQKAYDRLPACCQKDNEPH